MKIFNIIEYILICFILCCVVALFLQFPIDNHYIHILLFTGFSLYIVINIIAKTPLLVVTGLVLCLFALFTSMYCHILLAFLFSFIGLFLIFIAVIKQLKT